ncbi:abscisic acid 8'-hydroxylase 4 isoform X2 [Canna indica]|uniref:Abscisic acid 8'-hydroxylase 4 isoform X2 n=1 Tax=Canna indica TaxID=4628 RepID=A0AAQ3JWN9_9LILI|nr:abscisic acid 8'-hydroxylase 4 isoform X2 [Canna indica]
MVNMTLHLLTPPFFQLVPLVLLAFIVLRTLLKAIPSSRKAAVAASPPGNTGLPLIGETLAFLAAYNSSRGVYDFVRIRHLRYGRCFKTSILGCTHVFVSSTEVAKTLLGSESPDFTKRYIRSIAELLGHQSLLCSSHEQHKFIRRHISSTFKLEAMDSTIKKFDELVVDTLRSWEKMEQILVLRDALKVTFNAICKMLISIEDEHELEILRNDIFEVSEAMLAFPLKLPGTRFYRALKARERIMNRLRKMIDLRKRELECHEDFLQDLLKKDESCNNDSLTDEQIMDNILTLIIAGQVTTASSIAWMVKYLDENQEILEKLRALYLELPCKDSASPFGFEVLNLMPYAIKIVKESLRMASIVSWFPRVALKDCEIEGFKIRKGWIVNVNARSVHYDPMAYDEPFKFNPSRFDEDSKPYSFMAFGIGGRICMGMNLAKAMMLVFLHRLITTYRYKVIEADTSLQKGAMFPMLRNGCPIAVTPVTKEPN